MKHLPLLALALLFSFPAYSSSIDDNYKVLGNHKELKVIIAEVDKNVFGVTDWNLEKIIKKRLKKNGIKPLTLDYSLKEAMQKHWLYLESQIMDIDLGARTLGVAVKINISLEKKSRLYVSPDHGASLDHVPTVFRSAQDSWLGIKTSKADVLELVERVVDTFILKYLEANME